MYRCIELEEEEEMDTRQSSKVAILKSRTTWRVYRCVLVKPRSLFVDFACGIRTHIHLCVAFTLVFSYVWLCLAFVAVISAPGSGSIIPGSPLTEAS